MAPYRVCFGCVTDDHPRYQRCAILLATSLRQLGGEYADADFVICVVGKLDPALLPLAERVRAEVIEVPPIAPHRPPSHKLRFLLRPELAAYDYGVLIDCDAAIAGSPARMFGGTGVRARMAGRATVPNAVLADLLRRESLPVPDLCYFATTSHEPLTLYCNSGVVVVAGSVVQTFALAWYDYQNMLLAAPELLPGCAQHTNQASLTLALVASGVTFEPLDLSLHFPIHRTPADFRTPDIDRIDPMLLHYSLIHEDVLPPCRPLGANAAIARVNAAWQRAHAPA
jgi:hypothetical protein